MRFAGARFFEIIEGAWTSEYAFVASFPAYLRMTVKIELRSNSEAEIKDLAYYPCRPDAWAQTL